jgi:peptide/nickel transport system substrate-binding protein
MARKLHLVRGMAVIAVISLAAAACGRPAGSSGNAGNVSPVNGLVSITRAGTSKVSSVTWAVYRDVNSLDPIYAFDYPENTADSLMCESLLKQAPDGSVVPGLATLSYRSPTRLVLTIRPGVTFWDGHAVTPADVVYSLGRDMNIKLGGFYAVIFNRVRSIAATGPRQVTITLTQPDYWLPGQLASIGGIVIEKSYAQRQGRNYGTPAGGIMCTGAYMLKSWKPGVGVLAVANPHYWNPAVHPLVQQILIKGVPDVAAFTAAMLTGAIQGSYSYGLSTLDQLKSSSTVRVYEGPGWSTDAFVVSSLKGVLGDVRVRRALSMALNRQAIISSVYKGAALMPRWLSNPGTFAYAKAVFTSAYNSSPVLTQNIAAARKLVRAAGAVGKTLTIGTSSELTDIAAVTGAYQAAAQAIGLKVRLDSVSAQNYIDFFIDPKARVGVDGFMSINYGDWADPVAMLRVFDLPGGVENYDNFNDPAITNLLERERGTANATHRAMLIAQAEKLTVQQMPWIPSVQPVTLLLLNKSLTGAVASFAYMFAPWADRLGGTG